MRQHAVSLAVGLAMLVGVGAAIAQSPAYTLEGAEIGTEQVARGETAYFDNCAGCHGEDLRSMDSNAPDLRGPSFKASWTGRPLLERYEQIHATMPPYDPGSLPEQTYVDIMAYVLSINGVPASDTGELVYSTEALEGATVVAQ
jgi:S-disulfanyl-L-cysteine oxidoreductase SoxD